MNNNYIGLRLMSFIPASPLSRRTALWLAMSGAAGTATAQVPLPDEATLDSAEERLADERLESGVFVEEVVVIGVRGSQAKAIEIKRNASEIVDSIVAEDIGRLPDVTITDSLQRIAGVQINREANEGTSLNIRGMPQVLTTLNGEQFLSPWNITTVGANYGDVPAGMISGADVYKSASASQVAGGISGLVNLKTFSPLDLDKGITANARVELSAGSRSRDELKADGSTDTRAPDYNLNVFLGANLDDRAGVTFGLFKNSTYAANYSSRFDEFRFAYLDRQGGIPGDPLDLNGNGDTENDWYLTTPRYNANSNFMEREREGASLTLEAALNDSFMVRGDVFYTRMDQFDRGVSATYNGQNNIRAYEVNGEFTLNPAGERYTEELYDVLQPGSVTSPDGTFAYTDFDGNPQRRTINTVQTAVLESADFTTRSTNDINRTAALNTNLQLDYTNMYNFRASARIVYAEAERQMRTVQLTQGAPAWLYVNQDDIAGKDPVDPFEVTVDYGGQYPVFTAFQGVDGDGNPLPADVSSADRLELYQSSGQGENTSASLAVVRLDGSFEFVGTDWADTVDFGVRHSVREAERQQFYYVSPTSRYSNYDDQRVPEDLRYRLREGNAVWQKYPEWRRFDIADEEPQLTNPDVGGLQDNGFGRADTITFSDFGPIRGFENGVSAVNPEVWDNPLVFLNRLYPGTQTAEEPGQSYQVTETTNTLYGQLNFGSEVGDIPFSGNVGARVVRIEREVESAVVPAVLDRFNSIGFEEYNRIAFVGETQTREVSFTHVLPSVNFNLYPSDDVVVRLAAASTISRNDLQNVGSSLTLYYGRCVQTDADGRPVPTLDGSGRATNAEVSCVNSGNDQGRYDLEPWQANVYNTSLEWYFGDNAIVGGGLFLIDIATAVESFQEQRSYPDADGINRNRAANVYVTDNSSASDLYGLEFGYRQPFTFLPGDFLSAFGAEFNYTYSQSESTDEDLNGDSFPLPSNSEHQTNAILWWDRMASTCAWPTTGAARNLPAGWA